MEPSRQGDGPTASRERFEHQLRRATALLTEQRLDEAHDAAMEALTLRPANLLAQNLLGLILFHQQRFDPAVEVFESLSRRNSDVVALRLNAALTYLQLGDSARALEHLRRAVEINPSYPRAFGYLALIHLRRSEHQLARAALLEAGHTDLASDVKDGATEVRPEVIERLEKRLRAMGPAPGRPAPYEGFAEVQTAAPAATESLAVGPPLAVVSTLDATALSTNPWGGTSTADYVIHAEMPSNEEKDAFPSAVLEFEEVRSQPPSSELAPLPSTVVSLRPPSSELQPLSSTVVDPRPPSSELAPLSSTVVAPRPPSSELQPLSSTVVDPRPPSSELQPLSPAAVDSSLAPPSLIQDAITLPDDGPPAKLTRGLLLLRFPEHRGRPRSALVRKDRLVAETGQLRWDVARRRRKGADQEPFIVNEEGMTIQRAEGVGSLALDAGDGRRLKLLTLEEQGLYLCEECLVACSGDLHLENGRIPGAGPDGPAMLRLQGKGFVGIAVIGQFVTVAVSEATEVRVPLDRLLGWSGRAVPHLVASASTGDRRTVGFSGSGVVMLLVAEAPP